MYVKLVQFEVPFHQLIGNCYSEHQSAIKTTMNFEKLSIFDDTNNHFTYKMTNSNHFRITSTWMV